jgi:glutamate formiminotransferase/formiminotetrahydrofolate cyclodeaminase
VTDTTRFRDQTVAQFVDRLASGEPVPGGGAAAAVAGSLGAALVAMVGTLSADRPKYAAHAALHARVVPEAHALADRLLALADEDAAAYAGYGAALKLPKETDQEQATRAAAIREAALAATLSPLRTVEASLEVATLAELLAGRSNRNAASDLEVAALLAVTASRAAEANVRINLPSLGDEAAARELGSRAASLAAEVERLAALTREIVDGGEARDPLPEVVA